MFKRNRGKDIFNKKINTWLWYLGNNKINDGLFKNKKRSKNKSSS